MNYYRIPNQVLTTVGGPAYIMNEGGGTILHFSDSRMLLIPTMVARCSPSIVGQDWSTELANRAKDQIRSHFRSQSASMLHACQDAYRISEKMDPAAMVLVDLGETFIEVVPNCSWEATFTFGVAALSSVPDILVGTAPTEVLKEPQ